MRATDLNNPHHDRNNPRPDIPVYAGAPDLIENIVARMEGKTLATGSPEEFVKAVADIRHVILTPNSNDHVPSR
jgi:hypothetical protein